jgi:glycerol-3-phosphate O-acyltransferase
VIDPAGYVSRRGTPTVDYARDAAYTRELGKAIADRYLAETVVMPTQLVAHIIFRRMCRATPGLDLFSRLRHRGDIAIPIDELVPELGAARDELVKLEEQGKVHVNAALRSATPERVLDRALGAWDGYHQRPIARVVNGSVIAEDPNLLLFYQNRLRHFAVDIAGDQPADQVAAREIRAMEVMR